MARPAASRDRCQTSGNQFKCEHCGRLFSTKGNLSRHVQATHVGGQTFPCLTCGKEFKRKEDRTTHMRVHTGEYAAMSVEVVRIIQVVVLLLHNNSGINKYELVLLLLCWYPVHNRTIHNMHGVLEPYIKTAVHFAGTALTAPHSAFIPTYGHAGLGPPCVFVCVWISHSFPGPLQHGGDVADPGSLARHTTVVVQ